MALPQKNASRDVGTSYSDTAAPTIIESKNGGVLLVGEQGAALRGVQIDAKKDVAVKGATVSVIDAVNEQSNSSTHYEKNLNLGTETWWRDPGTGINAKRTDTDAGQRTSLAGTSLNGANVNLLAVDKDGNKGTLSLGAITVNTSGKLTLEADRLVMATQTTKEEQSHTSAGRDLAWQKLVCQLDQKVCDVQSAKMALGLGVALAGGPAASYLLSSLPAIAAAAKMTAAACAAAPVLCANRAGLVVADLLASEALGGASPAGSAAGAKADNAILNRADALLYNDLAARAKI